jgi:hypothetical protein
MGVSTCRPLKASASFSLSVLLAFLMPAAMDMTAE